MKTKIVNGLQVATQKIYKSKDIRKIDFILDQIGGYEKLHSFLNDQAETKSQTQALNALSDLVSQGQTEYHLITIADIDKIYKEKRKHWIPEFKKGRRTKTEPVKIALKAGRKEDEVVIPRTIFSTLSAETEGKQFVIVSQGKKGKDGTFSFTITVE
jgi:hypothetical protein